MKYESIIFDLDGTLLDTLDDLMDAVNHTLESHGMPTRTYEEIRSFVGNGVGVLVKKSLPADTSDEDFENMLPEFKEYYRTHSRVKTKPYDGVLDMIKTIKERGVPCAIVSNKVDNAVKDLNELYFSNMIDVAIGEIDGIKRKPAPDMVKIAMKKLGVSCGVYIGDSEVDVETAKNSGLDGIFVSWGFRDRDTLEKAGATIIADTVEELMSFLSL